MNPIEVAVYCLQAGAFVLSLFFGIKILTAPLMEREFWRELLKRKVYFNRKTFNLLLNLVGVMLVLLALYVGTVSILNVVENWS